MKTFPLPLLILLLSGVASCAPAPPRPTATWAHEHGPADVKAAEEALLAGVMIGAPRRRVLELYGPPEYTQMKYDSFGTFHFDNGRLSASYGPPGKPYDSVALPVTGPVKAGISSDKVERLLGPPQSMLDFYRLPSGLDHVFEYRDGKVSEKNAIVPPMP